MIIARAPVRVSLAGGGTDMPSYFQKHGGLVVSTAINRYLYVIVTVGADQSLQITSSDYRIFYRHPRGRDLQVEGELTLPKAVLRRFGIDGGLHVFTASEIPPGTGLGSSSAAAVALVRALAALCDEPLTAAEVAALACRIETEDLGMPIGYQDQYAASLGGLNAIRFEADGVTSRPLELPRARREEIERRMLLFFTGISRHSGAILSHQNRAIHDRDETVLASLHRIKQAAAAMESALLSGDLDLVGEILDASWQEKRRLASGISNARIDEYYAVARREGALGGKITGAGGGGFLLIWAHPDSAERVAAALEARGLHRMDYRLEESGCQVLMNAMPHLPHCRADRRRLTEGVDALAP